MKCIINSRFSTSSYKNIIIIPFPNKEMLYYHLSRWSITCDESSTSKEISDRKNNKKSIWKYRFQFYFFLLQTTFLVCCKNESILFKKIYRSLWHLTKFFMEKWLINIFCYKVIFSLQRNIHIYTIVFKREKCTYNLCIYYGRYWAISLFY